MQARFSVVNGKGQISTFWSSFCESNGIVPGRFYFSRFSQTREGLVGAIDILPY